MELSIIVTKQVLIMFLLIGVGIICAKTNLLSRDTNVDLSRFVMTVIMPVLIVMSYQQEFTKERAIGVVIAFALAVLAHLIGIVLSPFVFRKQPGDHYRIERYSIINANCGFMGFPILTALLGPEGVFYGSTFLAVFSLISWTQGILLLTGDRSKLSVKRLLTNPGVISTTIGIVLFMFAITLPEILAVPLNYISNTNTAIAMIVIGGFIARSNVKKAIASPKIYVVVLFRLLIIPFILLLLLRLMHVPDPIFTVILVCASCPTGSSATTLPAMFGLDAEYGSQIIAVTTLFSVISMPLIVYLSTLIVF